MHRELADVSKAYAEDPNLGREDVLQISEWLETQPHLPKLLELQIILFLHSCYYEVEETKNSIENYFTFRTNSDLFKDLNEEFIRRVSSVTFVGILPKLTPNGDAVVLMKVLDTRPESYNLAEHTEVLMMSLLLHLHQFGPREGVIAVADLKGVGWGHVKRMGVSALKKYIYFLEEAAPLRNKGTHLINVGPVVRQIVRLIKPLSKKQVFDKLKIHSRSLESFYDYVPRECLPEEYGGTLPSLNILQERNVESLVESLDFFAWHNSQEVDESKRKTKNKSFFTGLQAFFRNIDID